MEAIDGELPSQFEAAALPQLPEGYTVRVGRVVKSTLVGLGVGCMVSGAAFGFFRSELPGPGQALPSGLRSVPVASSVYTAQMSAGQRAQIAALTSASSLTPSAAARVPGALMTLDAVERMQFDILLKAASSNTERGFLYKALAAGEPTATINTFAREIRGMNEAELVAVLNPAALTTPLDTVAPANLGQLSEDSCAAAEAQLMRAWADPIYAHQLYTQGDWQGAAVKSSQLEIVEREGGDISANTPFPGGIIGMTNRGQMDEYNALTPLTGVTYEMYYVTPASANAAYDAVVSALEAHAIVPMDVGDTQVRHATMILATKDGDLLVHDPGYGVTGWMTKAQFVDSLLNTFQGGGNGAGGWNEAYRVALPTSIAAPGLTPVPITAPEVPGLLVWLGVALAGGVLGTVGDITLQAAQCLRRRRVAPRPVAPPPEIG